jgi:hypothetical protein
MRVISLGLLGRLETAMAETASVEDKISMYARRTAAVNGSLCLVGISVAAFVYLYFPHLDGIHHVTARFDRHDVVESTESYLFFSPGFQIWLFIVPAMSVWWPAFRRAGIASQDRTAVRFPAIRSVSSENRVQLYRLVAIIFVVAEYLSLMVTIYRSVLLATDGV